ncbi:hypothetical protein [Aureimonas jatrophae]|uniref:Uncharacterized protein n=1 Tax=Aureimonas jatrophae TaxID=1166073 RepID=A0A1H0K3J2_9HYPH|nr:hypothetical protein [Aureimonas jatrophae]MBB3950927.1 hypothetical protein [Aureimonas jatrophae]SDO50444.1 hypothetical protein SAMN05192530_10773 [Aureimonas jatrophae]
MTTPLAGALLLLFFAPLAFIYGRSLAGRLHAQAAVQQRSALVLMLPKLVLPTLVAAALAVRFSGTLPENWPVTVPSPTLRAALSALWTLGSVAGILFFLAIPFVLGRLVALVAVASGWFTGVRDEPLRFGTSGYKNEDEPGETGFRQASRRGVDEGSGPND